MNTDDLILTVGGRAFSGWTGIRVTQGIERVPNDFEIEMTELYPDEIGSFLITPGDFCTVKLGDDVVVTGYIDRVIPMIDSRMHSIRVSGRGKCQDLVDCSAEWPGGQITGSLLDIASRLVKPYGQPNNQIMVGSTVTDIGPVIPQFQLNRGETPMAIIELLARYSGVLAYEEASGDLLLSGVSSEKAASGFTQGENIQQASIMYGMDQIYSEILAFAQSVETFADLGPGGDLIATVNVKNVPRHRRKIVVAENGDSGFEVLKKRATWEAARRYGRSKQLRLTTDSWRDADGNLWKPNTLVPVLAPALKITEKVEWLISDVTFKRDGHTGTTADLTIMPKEAFMPQPIVFMPVAVEIKG